MQSQYLKKLKLAASIRESDYWLNSYKINISCVLNKKETIKINELLAVSFLTHCFHKQTCN